MIMDKENKKDSNLDMTEDACVLRQISEGTSCSEALPKLCDPWLTHGLRDCVNFSFAVYVGFIEALDKDDFQFIFYSKKKKLNCKVSVEAALDYCDCLDIIKSCCLPFHLIVCNVSINQRVSFLPICGWLRKKSHDAYILHDLKIFNFSPEVKIAVMEDQNDVLHFLLCNSFEMFSEVHKADKSLPLHVIVENIPLLQAKGYVVRQRILFISNERELAFAALKFLVLCELDNEMLDCKSADEHIAVSNCYVDQNPSNNAIHCYSQSNEFSTQHKPDCKFACLQDIRTWQTDHVSSSDERTHLGKRKLIIDVPGDILHILQSYNENSSEACNCSLGITYFVPSQAFKVEDQMKRSVGRFRRITEDYGIISCKIKAEDVVCHRSVVYIDGRSIASLHELKEDVLMNVYVIAVPLTENVTIKYKSSYVRYIAAVAWHGAAPDLLGIHHCYNHRPTLFCVDGNHLPRCVDLCTSSEDEEAALNCGKGRIILYSGKCSLKGSRLNEVDVELDSIFTKEVAFFCKAMKGLLWCPLSWIYISGVRCQSVHDISNIRKFKCIYNVDSLQNLDVSEKKYCIIAFAKSSVIPGIHICENHVSILVTRVMARDCVASEGGKYHREIIQDLSDKNLKCIWKDVAVTGGASVSTPEISSDDHDGDRLKRERMNQLHFIDIQPILRSGIKIQTWECMHVEENFALLCSARIYGILLQEDFYLSQNGLCSPEEFTTRMFVGQEYKGLFTEIQQHLLINDKLVSHVAVFVYCRKKPSEKIRSDLKSKLVRPKCLRVLNSITSLSVASYIPPVQIESLLSGYNSDIKKGVSSQVINTNCIAKVYNENDKNASDDIVSTSNIDSIVTDNYNINIKPPQCEKNSISPESITKDLLFNIRLTDKRADRSLKCLHIEENFALLHSKKMKNKMYALLLREDFCHVPGKICSPGEFKFMMTGDQGCNGVFAKMQEDLIVRGIHGCVVVTHVAVVAFIGKKPFNFKQILLDSSRNPFKQLKAQCSSISVTRAMTPSSVQSSHLASYAASGTIERGRECEATVSNRNPTYHLINDTREVPGNCTCQQALPESRNFSDEWAFNFSNRFLESTTGCLMGSREATKLLNTEREYVNVGSLGMSCVNSGDEGTACANTQKIKSMVCNEVDSSSTRRKITSAESMPLSEAAKVKRSPGKLGQLQVIAISPESILDIEHAVCTCMHVDNTFALLKSSKIVGIALQEDFYITQSDCCSPAEFKNKMIVTKCYNGIFTKIKHDLIIEDQLVTHVAIFSYVGKKPLLSEQMIVQWKSNPVKWLRLQRSCSDKTERNPLSVAPSGKQGSQVAISLIKEQEDGTSTYKQCSQKCVEATGKICKLIVKSGLLVIYSQSYENGRATVFFDESLVYIDKKRIPADKSFVEVLTPLQEEPWSCIARPFPKKKEKKRVISGVEVDMIAMMVWNGSKPSKQERKMADEEIISQCLKTKFESKVSRTNKKRTGKEIFTGRVVACQETFGWLKAEDEEEWVFERDNGFLYGITLREVDLTYVLPVGTKVWFSLSDDKLSIIRVWAGGYHHLVGHDLVEKIRKWCENFGVSQNDTDILLVEAGWLSPKFEPTIAIGDEKEVADIC